MPSKEIKWEDHGDLREWKEVATEKQRFYYEFLKNRRWELYEPTEHELLKTKILFALYGPPVNVQETTMETFYNATQKKTMEDIFHAIKKVNKQSTNFIVGFLFFVATIENKYTEFPVIRVLKNKEEDGTEHFSIVDSVGYLYKSWKKFLDTNIIPNCIYCYPKDGFYSCDFSGEVELVFSYSPQSYSIYTGMVSAVGSILPGRSSLAEHLPIPLISVIKGVAPQRRYYWIPVTSASGSCDLYFVHSTHGLAQSCQSLEEIPHVIYEALEKGYLKLNWYAVLNEIKNIIRNSSKTTNTHVAQVIVMALFFCHSVLSVQVTKKLLREIRNDLSNNKKFKLDHISQIALETSTSLKKKSTAYPLTIILKFIDDKVGLMDEIIEKRFKANFLIPDHLGNKYTVSTLTEKLGSTDETKLYSDIIINYCLVLEEIIRNCSCCNKIIDDHNKFIETLNIKVENTLTEEKEILEDKSSVPPQTKRMTASEEQQNTTKVKPYIKENSSALSPPYLEYEETDVTCGKSACFPFNLSSKESSNDIENKKDCLINDWLRANFFNKFASPLPVTPKKGDENQKPSAEEKGMELNEKPSGFENTPNNLCKGSQYNNESFSNIEKNINESPLVLMVLTDQNGTQETPIRSTNSSVKSILRNVSKEDKSELESVIKNGFEVDLEEQKLSTEGSLNENIEKEQFFDLISLMDENDLSVLMSNEAPSKNAKEGKYDYSKNINTPESKKCEKKVCIREIVKTHTPLSSEEKRMDKSELSKDDKLSVTKHHEAFAEPNGEEIPLTPKESEEFLNCSSPENLSGKMFIFSREIDPSLELGPYDYYRTFVEKDLRDIKSVYLIPNQNKEKNWQFILYEEILGVKIIKIYVNEENTEETIVIKYY